MSDIMIFVINICRCSVVEETLDITRNTFNDHKGSYFVLGNAVQQLFVQYLS